MYTYFGENEVPKVENLYPVTIIRARYSGAYEGGAWLAFNCDPDNVPTDVWADDVSCFLFFDDYNKMTVKQRRKNPLKIGRGANPQEAMKDLVRQYHETATTN